MLITRSFYLEGVSDSNNTDMYYAYDIGNVRLAKGRIAGAHRSASSDDGCGLRSLLGLSCLSAAVYSVSKNPAIVPKYKALVQSFLHKV